MAVPVSLPAHADRKILLDPFRQQRGIIFSARNCLSFDGQGLLPPLMESENVPLVMFTRPCWASWVYCT